MKNRKVFVDNLRKENNSLKTALDISSKFNFETDLDFTRETTMLRYKTEIFAKLKEINLSDKWIYEKGVKAFISLIRFYQEHDLKYIFDVNRIDLGNLANGFSLLRLPRLREIIGKKIENFQQDKDINPKDLIYLSTNVAKQMHEKEE